MKKTINRFRFTIGKWTFVCGRWVIFSAAVLTILFSIFLIAARIWLPDIAEKKSEIEEFISEQTGLVVRMAEIQPYWNGIYPGLIIKDVNLTDQANANNAQNFSEIRASLAMLPFLRGSIEFSQLIIINEKIIVKKDKNGKLFFNNWKLPEENKKQDKNLFEWLGHLHHVIIITKNFVWDDKYSNSKKFVVKNSKLDLVNSGLQHKLEITGDFPEKFCRSCTLRINTSSAALILTDLTGSLELDAVDLDVSNVPGTAKSLLPEKLSGLFQAQLYSEFVSGNLVSLKGYVIADDLLLPAKNKKVAKIKTISGKVNWDAEDDDWRLLITDLSLGLTSEEWGAGRLRFEKTGNKKLLYIERANLSDLSEYIRQVNTDLEEIEFIKKLSPGGEVHNLRLEFENNFSSIANASLEAELLDVKISQISDYPSAKGISGKLNMKGEQGEFNFNSRDSSILVPQLFRAPIETEKLTGIASWYKRKDAWEINMQDLKIVAEDLKAESNFQILIHDDEARLPTVNLRVDFREGRGYRTPLFYPKNLASPALLAWLDRALQTGYVNKGYAVLEGPLDNFPFKDGSGKFEVLVDISDATLDYLSGWAPLEEAEALLKFNGGEMVITVESGKINGLDIRGATAYANDLTTDEGSVINVSGSAYGPVESAINVLRKTPQGSTGGSWEQWLNPNLHVDGEGALDLQVSFLPGDGKDPVLNGTYKTKNSTVILPWKGVEVERISGEVGFDGQGVKNGEVKGRFFGGPINLELGRQDKTSNGELRNTPLVKLTASGGVTSKNITDTFAGWMQPYASGTANWQATLAWDENIYLDLNTNLQNFALNFPEPFKKIKKQKASFEIKTVSSGRNHLLLGYNLYDASKGKLSFRKEKGKWDFYGAHLGVFDVIPDEPKKSGVQLSIISKDLDADKWADVLKSYFSEDSHGEAFIDNLHVRFDNLDIFNKHFGALDAKLKRRNDALVGVADGTSITGKIKFNSNEESPDIEFDLSRLSIPIDSFRESTGRMNPRGFPSMNVRTKAFHFGDATFGETEFKGSRESLGYRVSRFFIDGKDYNMIGRGRWYRIGNKDDAEARISFTSKNLGKALDSMGSPNQVVDGEGAFKANLRWSKTEGVGFAGMDGDAELKFKKGRFLQLEQGAGRMFGLLDMSSIMRYLRLDLSSIFGKGFLFDSMKAKFTIKDGSAHTSNMNIKGPSADMLITGNIGIEKQDFDMVVGVNPSLTDTLALTVVGPLAPQVGAAILILKNVFNTDLVPSPSINYSVKGTWDKPVVDKLTGDEGADKSNKPKKSEQTRDFDDDSTS